MTGTPPSLLPPFWLFFAVKEEAQPFLKSLPSLGWRPEPTAGKGHRFRREGSTLRLFISGMGARSARATWEAAGVQGERPGCVLSCGFAGALDPVLSVGELLCQGNRFCPPLPFEEGRFLSSERVILKAEEKGRLFRESGCRAVEMESALYHEFCDPLGIPCATLRVISNAADEDLPLDFGALTKEDGKISLPALALDILRRPSKISALIRLGKNSRLAARNLSEGLTTLL